MKIDKKLLAELQNATIIAGGAAAFARECGVDPANISRYLNGKVHTISDDNWEKLAPRLNSLSPTPPPRDVIRNTAVLRECVKDAMLRLNVRDATTLCRLSGYDATETVERLLAGKLDWFPDVLAAVLTALEINYDDAPLSPAERALLTPSDMLRDGALLVRPVPVVEWANATGHLDLLGADNRSVNRYWHRHDCETVLTPIGGRRDTLAFRICGVSMEPTLQDHDIILVEPALAIDDVPENKIVVARLRDVKNLDDCVVCKRFHRKSDGLLLLSSDNPNGRTITCHASNLTWLGVAVKKLSSL